MKLEHLIVRSNKTANFIKDHLGSLDDSILRQKPNQKSWSLLEIIEHLNLVYDKYLENLEHVISEAPAGNHEESFYQTTVLGKLSIYSMKPKKRKRRFKMKTFDFFTPEYDQLDTQRVLKDFFHNKVTFNSLIDLARKKDLKGLKVPTALGDKIRFYIPECLDFIISHEERHKIQLEDTFEYINTHKSIVS